MQVGCGGKPNQIQASAFLETKKCQYACLMLALRPHALNCMTFITVLHASHAFLFGFCNAY